MTVNSSPTSVRVRQVRSSDSVTCAVRRTRTTYGDRCFAVAGPRVWNSLPTELRKSDSLGQFKRWLFVISAIEMFLLTYLLTYLLTDRRTKFLHPWLITDKYYENISAVEMYSTICVERPVIILVLSWRNSILFDEYMREKRFLHFCSRWPWPLDLIFAPLFPKN